MARDRFRDFAKALGGCLVGLVLCLCTNESRAQDAATQAKQNFERGLAHADRGEIDAAIEAFEAAYAASPHPTVLFNLGQAYSISGRPVEALRALRTYLEQAKPDAARKAEAEQLVRFNEGRVGRVTLSVEPAEARLFIDGRAYGLASEVTTLELAAGTHVLRAEANGYRDATQEFVLRPWRGEEARIALALEPTPLPAAPLPPREALPVPEQDAAGLLKVARRKRVAAFVTGGVGLSAGLAAVALLLVNEKRSESFQNTNWEDANAMVDRAMSIQRLDDAAVTCAVAGGVLIGTAITLWLLSRRERLASPSRKALGYHPELHAFRVRF